MFCICRRLLVEHDPTIVPSLLYLPHWLHLPIHQQPNSVANKLIIFVPVSDVEIFLFQIRGWERKPWGESSADTAEWESGGGTVGRFSSDMT